MPRSDYSPRDVARESVKGGVSAIVVGVIVVVVLLAVGAVGVFGFGWFRQGTADFRGETDKKEQVEGNGSYRIAAYDHFFNLCASVQSNETSIANLQQELDGTPPPSAERASQLRASITAQRNQRGESINQYNVDAAKDYTLGQFQSSKLLYHLDTTKEKTECVTR